MQLRGSFRCLRMFASSIAAATVAASGCCATAPVATPDPIRQSNIVFNPIDSQLASTNVVRADWPTTYLEFTTRDETAYSERIIDIQGRRHGFGEDYLYRRFESSRDGVGRR